MLNQSLQSKVSDINQVSKYINQTIQTGTNPFFFVEKISCTSTCGKDNVELIVLRSEIKKWMSQCCENEDMYDPLPKLNPTYHNMTHLKSLATLESHS